MNRFLRIFTLIVAGEIIFSLPFHTTRFFRPTLLEAFNFSNTQLGDVFAVYGVTAMLSYFPGGMLADRFSTRKLLSVSLWATAAGGLYMATYPGTIGMALLYGYWGVTSILLFWAALISATRSWGGDRTQGMAFGLLEGGRGLMAALLALFAVGILARFLPLDVTSATIDQRLDGFRVVILFYTAVTTLTGFLTWYLMPKHHSPTTEPHGSRLSDALMVVRRPVVWAQAAVVVCAYCGYKGLDNYSLYAVQVLGMDEIEAARFTAWASYLRPVAAVMAGVIADRLSTGKTLTSTFGVLILAYGLLATLTPSAAWSNMIMASILISFFAVFALRGIYFALLQETGTPSRLTGTTVGVVSFIGFTPEIFFSPITGRILDYSPGIAGHHNYFLFLAAVATAGALVALSLLWLGKSTTKPPENT